MAGHRSLWLQEALAGAEDQPPLRGDVRADVCIVGGGFTGLWTAYELCRADPRLEVVVLEREVAGFGASGRNGGWVVGALSGAREQWAERGGRAGALALERAIQETVDEIGRAVERERIECGFVKGGSLVVAQTEPELERVRAHVEADRAWGLEERDSVLLDAAQLGERVRVQGARGASFTPHCARVQPARLVRGLAEAAERAGAVVYEQTPVLAVEPHLARTPFGDVRARWVVRATEGYSVGLPGLRRAVAPINSSMIVTEPLGADAWAELGWQQAETMLDGRHLYAYLQRTPDDRIAIGGRGIPYRFGSKTDREGPPAERTVWELRARLRDLFGAAADVPLAGAWHGVLGVTRNWLPAVGVDRKTGLAWAAGYAGEGVAASNLAGRTLRDLLLGERTPLTELPWVSPPARPWEPEPFRYLGIRAVHGLYAAADASERRTGRRSRLEQLANLVSGRG